MCPPSTSPAAPATVESFLRCGDLASGFTRLQCPDCGHERLLAFTCKTRHFCPSCHQCRVRSTSDWIATAVCHEVPHRQFVFTIPKVLRGIFRKRLNLPDGKLGTIPDDEPDLDSFNRPRNSSNPDPEGFDQSPEWKPEEIHLDDGRILVLEYS